MKKWECIVCGWIYDESKGWPEDGIEPGTAWKDVPEDWLCPDCGVGKEDFEMVELKTPAVAAAASQPSPTAIIPDVDPIVIIGSGLAAYNLAKEFRKLDSLTPLMMISRDDGSLYYKPNLSAGLTQKKSPDGLVMSYAPTVATDLSLTLKTLSEVSKIDPDRKEIHFGNEVHPYSKLVIATGASSIIPAFAGTAADLTYAVNDLLDYRKYRSALVGKSKVLIIGAGLIGCEFTNDLLNHDMTVEVIEGTDRCMSALLPEAASRAVERALTDKGARFHFGTRVSAIDKAGEQFTVTLEDGTALNADLVVSAVGLRANCALAKDTGLETGRGISVNRYLETSTEDIYALGDVADVEGQLLMYVEPLLLSAKALAQTLSGTRTAVDYKVMAVAVKTPACPIIVATPPAHITGEWDVFEDGNNVEAVFRDSNGEIAGFALTGEATKQKKELEQNLPKLFT